MCVGVCLARLHVQVVSRPPVQVTPVETPLYAPAFFEIDVANPYPGDCTFKLSIIQAQQGTVCVRLHAYARFRASRLLCMYIYFVIATFVGACLRLLC